MLGPVVVRMGDQVLESVILRLRHLGVTPRTANICELALAVASGGFFACGEQSAGIAMVILHGVFDYLDGALSRAGAPGSTMTRHAWVDKLSDVLILSGAACGRFLTWRLALAATTTSIAATWLGLYGVGRHRLVREEVLFDRSDRVIIFVALAALLGLYQAVATILAMSAIVCGQRLATLGKQLQEHRQAGRSRP